MLVILENSLIIEPLFYIIYKIMRCYMRHYILVFAVLAVLLVPGASYAEGPSLKSAKATEETVIAEAIEKLVMDRRFVPSGWMGDYGDIKLDKECPADDQSDVLCQKWTYTARGEQNAGWSGVAWQYPENNWGESKGLDLTGYTKLTFRAKGERGGEVVELHVGGFDSSVELTYGPIYLKKDWKEYEIDLSRSDLSNVTCAFAWMVKGKYNWSGCSFYLDDIVYE